MQLPLRTIGSHPVQVSALSLGTVKFGRNQGVKYPAAFQLPSDQQILDLLDHAKAYGITLLDTAPAYGSSESRLGQLLEQQQESWQICTKVGEEFVDGKSVYDFSPDAVKKSVEQSLIRLGREKLDIVLMHSNGEDERILRHSGAIETLRKLQDQGAIGLVGFSGKTVEGGLLAASLCDVLMVYHNLWYREEESVLDRCGELGTGVLI
ncbi:MAG: aldo/keto reductase, partial [Verrucomicrobiales bacterium]